MDTYPRPTAISALWRGATGRCARCGSRGLFGRWMTIVEDCPRCGLHFERSQGYWLGAIVINLAVTIGLFVVLFVGGMVLLWPDVPWNTMSIVLIITMLVFPILFYPISITLWIAGERQIRSRSEAYT